MSAVRRISVFSVKGDGELPRRTLEVANRLLG